jgi:hypothetical protein
MKFPQSSSGNPSKTLAKPYRFLVKDKRKSPFLGEKRLDDELLAELRVLGHFSGACLKK